ncbi:GIY-YIG nuclease family protein [Mesoflavibacter zeaxanthinifaciens]|uniref:GIY-YIG nuclease family protein n=1 Tax=Mesoflavibacter zeaxanthinifaciens TaxID=393060 RepID=UPI003A905626
MKGWMYILECSDGSYYTGSTNNLELRMEQHQNGEGANHTKKRLPVKLLYTEEFTRVDDAFYREKQVQGWSRKKKEALINGDFDKLSHLSKNYTQFSEAMVASTGSATETAEVTGVTKATEVSKNAVASTSSATGKNTSSATGKNTSSATEVSKNAVPELAEGIALSENNENPLPESVEIIEGNDKSVKL